MKRGGDIMSVHQMLVIRIRPFLSGFFLGVGVNFTPKIGHATKFWSFLPKIGHATHSNCHCDQILGNFTKNWLHDQFQ